MLIWCFLLMLIENSLILSCSGYWRSEVTPDWGLWNWNCNIISRQILCWSHFHLWPMRNIDIYSKNTCICKTIWQHDFNLTTLTLLFCWGKASHHQPRTTWHQCPCFCGTALHIAWKGFPAIIKAKQMATSIPLIQTWKGNCTLCLSHSCYFIVNNHSWTCNNIPNYHHANRESIKLCT